MRKKIVVASLIILSAVVIYCVLGLTTDVVPFPNALKEILWDSDSELTDIERIALVIRQEHPTDVIVLGDNVQFQAEIDTRNISKVTEEQLKKEKNYEQTFLIINDLKNKVKLSDEEINLLKSKIATESFCLYYLGTQYSTVWDDPTQYVVDVEGNLAWKYYQVDGNPQRSVGSWTRNEQSVLEEYPSMLGDAILYEIDNFLKAIN